MLLCGSLCLTLAACGGTGSDAPSSTPPATATPQQSAENTPTPVSTPAPAKELEASGTLGKYAAEIKDCVFTKDYADRPAIVITYTFTNNNDNATSAMASLNGFAFQNGVQLDAAVVMNDTVDAESYMKDVKPGASLDIQFAYSLNSDTAPVEYELGELISFSNELLGRTFPVADGGITELATIDVPADTVSGTIKDYEVSIIACTKTKDYSGADAVIVTYGFKNNSDDKANMATALSYKVFQDGVELSTAVISDDENMDAGSQMRYVKPGAAITVTAGYVLSSTSDVEVDVTDLFSMGSENLNSTFALS